MEKRVGIYTASAQNMVGEYRVFQSRAAIQQSDPQGFWVFSARLAHEGEECRVQGGVFSTEEAAHQAARQWLGYDGHVHLLVRHEEATV